MRQVSSKHLASTELRPSSAPTLAIGPGCLEVVCGWRPQGSMMAPSRVARPKSSGGGPPVRTEVRRRENRGRHMNGNRLD